MYEPSPSGRPSNRQPIRHYGLWVAAWALANAVWLMASALLTALKGYEGLLDKLVALNNPRTIPINWWGVAWGHVPVGLMTLLAIIMIASLNQPTTQRSRR